MKLSKKTCYALRALAYLSKKDTPTSVREIAENEKLPLEYLEKIFQILRKHHFVNSERGVSGGYYLSSPPETITLKDVLSHLEPPLFLSPCKTKKLCKKSRQCTTQNAWKNLDHTIETSLQSVTLKDIAEKNL